MRPSLFSFCVVAATPCLLSLFNLNPGALKALLLMAVLSDGARTLSLSGQVGSSCKHSAGLGLCRRTREASLSSFLDLLVACLFLGLLNVHFPCKDTLSTLGNSESVPFFRRKQKSKKPNQINPQSLIFSRQS